MAPCFPAHLQPINMHSLSVNTAFAVLPLFLFAHASAIATPQSTLQLHAMTYKGCFNTSDPLVNQGPYLYQTSGYCQPICVGQSKPVMGLSRGSDCWCGDLLPAADGLVPDAECNSPCNGYDKENCMLCNVGMRSFALGLRDR